MNKPGELIKNAVQTGILRPGNSYVGMIADGVHYEFWGYMDSENYSSFIIQAYGVGYLFHVYCNNGQWYRTLINESNAETL